VTAQNVFMQNHVLKIWKEPFSNKTHKTINLFLIFAQFLIYL